MCFPLDNKCTIWNPISGDGLGGINYAGPYIVDSKNSTASEKQVDKEGNDFMSVGMVYTSSCELKIDSVVIFGESLALSPPAGANDIRKMTTSPSDANYIAKAWF